jgi:uncharacterized Zn finger protein (UPF0148 family)
MSQSKCIVCNLRNKEGALFCAACGKSWDRDAKKDQTIAAAVIWAAKRARNYERLRMMALRAKKQEKAPPEPDKTEWVRTWAHGLPESYFEPNVIRRVRRRTRDGVAWYVETPRGWVRWDRRLLSWYPTPSQD